MINKELNSVLKNIEQSNGLPNKNYIDNKQYDVQLNDSLVGVFTKL